MPATVGLPRALLYHEYGDLWNSFFESLDIETITSPESNRAILARGVQLSVDETCLPVKIYLGHVDYLANRADKVLVPRVESLNKRESSCVKLWGAVDVVRNSVPDADVLHYDIDVKHGKREPAELYRLGRSLGRSPAQVALAYGNARRESARIRRAHAQEQLAVAHSDGLKVLVVGHPYNVRDAMIGAPVVRILEQEGAKVLVAELVDRAEARAKSIELSRDVPWTFNKELLGAVEHFRTLVDGIVFLVTFPCGPDSLVTELCVRRLKDVPSIVLVLDELQGEAGLRTRMESFVDLLKVRSHRPLGDSGSVSGS